MGNPIKVVNAHTENHVSELWSNPNHIYDDKSGLPNASDLVKGHSDGINAQIEKNEQSEQKLIKGEERSLNMQEATDILEKGGKRAQIGEIRKFGGRDYIKTPGGWKFHGKGTGAKTAQHKKDVDDHHASKKTSKSKSLKIGDKVLISDVKTILSRYNGQKGTVSSISSQGVGVKFEDGSWKTFNKENVKKKESPTKETDKTAQGKHIGDMNKQEKLAWAKKQGIKNPETLSTKELDNKLVANNVQKELQKIKDKKKPVETKKEIKTIGKKLSATSDPYVTKIEQGNSWKAVMHPEHVESVQKLKDGESTSFKDEQSKTWKVTKVEGSIYNIEGVGNGYKGHFELSKVEKSKKNLAENIKKSVTDDEIQKAYEILGL